MQSLLNQSEEQLSPGARVAPIEAKGELVEVVLEVLPADRPLVRPEDPALEKRCHARDSRQELMGLLPFPAEDGHFALVAKDFKPVVALPPIGVDDRTGLDGGGNEAVKAALRRIGDAVEPDPTDSVAFLLSTNRNKRLRLRLTPRDAFFQAADVSLVDLDHALKSITPGADHCLPELVKPGPNCLVAPDPKDPLHTERAGSVPLARNEPDRPEPKRGSESAFLKTAPDLVVEIKSRSNTASRLKRKLNEYFALGVRLVWLAYPKRRIVRAYRSASDFEEYGEKDRLPGGDVLPGFSEPVSQLFA